MIHRPLVEFLILQFTSIPLIYFKNEMIKFNMFICIEWDMNNSQIW